MPLHVPTTFLVISLLAFVFALKMLLDSRSRRSAALGWWSAALLCIVGAGLLIVWRSSSQSFFGSGPANSLLLFGYGLLWRGAAVFAGRRAPLGLVALGTVAWGLAWQQGWVSDGPQALAFCSVVIIFYCLAAGTILLAMAEGLPAARQAGIILLLHCFVHALRIVTVVVLDHPREPLDKASLPATFFLLEALLFLVALSHLLLAMTRERGEQILLAAAQTDFLTGISNRRAFNVDAQRSLDSPAGRHALLLCDLDYFKSVNDAHGHAAGDAVLKLFCRVARVHLAKGDLLARLGGEEFAILLPDCEATAAVRHAEAIRAHFQEAALALEGRPIAVTVSIGIATTEGVGALDRMMEAADEMLYRAKAAGRNRVTVAPAPSVVATALLPAASPEAAPFAFTPG